MSAKGGNHANAYGDPLWQGIFDASYTRTGDYLVSDTGTYFVASQDALLPVLCVRTNRTISIAQPGMQTGTASNVYGGYTSGQSIRLMDRWPASVLDSTPIEPLQRQSADRSDDPVLERSGSVSHRRCSIAGRYHYGRSRKNRRYHWIRTVEFGMADQRKNGDHLNGRYR